MAATDQTTAEEREREVEFNPGGTVIETIDPLTNEVVNAGAGTTEAAIDKSRLTAVQYEEARGIAAELKQQGVPAAEATKRALDQVSGNSEDTSVDQDDTPAPGTHEEFVAQRQKEIAEQEAKAKEEPESEPEPEETQQDVLDTLVPKTTPVTRKIGKGDATFEYVQRELSFVNKLHFFGLVAEVIDKALSGENGMTVGHLFDGPVFSGGAITRQQLTEADTFIQAIAKLARYAPDFILDAYCIWLDVPDHEQYIVKELMSLPAEDGGLTDDEGIDIIETFIDQNWPAIQGFFTEQTVKVRNRVQKQMRDRPSQRSTR